jgi:hypothetical protein
MELSFVADENESTTKIFCTSLAKYAANLPLHVGQHMAAIFYKS